MPVGTHIGQLATSFIKEELPVQFLMRYTYDFLYRMKCTLLQLRRRANEGAEMTAHSVMEELIIYLCNQEALGFMEVSGCSDIMNGDEDLDDSEEWVFDMFGDEDIIILYSDYILDAEHAYDFSHWNDQQFYMK